MPPTSQEDIGSVLERFHKWAGHQAKPVRELSYEEAVARSRRRFYDEEEPVGPQPVTAAAAPLPAPPPIPFPLVKEPPANQPANKPSWPASAKSTKAAKPTAPNDPPQGNTGVTGSPEAPGVHAKPAKKGATRKKTASAAGPGSAQRKSAKRTRTKTLKAKAEAASQPGSVQPSPKNSTPAAAMEATNSTGATAASAYAAAQQAAEYESTDTADAGPLPKATFAQILAAQIELPEAEPVGTSPSHGSEPAAMPAACPAPPKVFSVSPLPDDAPAVHLTVRLASNERECLRERASDLGVTPSAYVRQCALEVDSLRTELDHARLAQAQTAAELVLAREEARSAKSEAALCLSTRTVQHRDKESEWFKRLRNFVFPRKAKGQAFATHA